MKHDFYYETKSHSIKLELLRDPERTNTLIASITGSSLSHVSMIRKKLNIPPYIAPKRTGHVPISKENNDWLIAEAKRVKIHKSVLLNAIVTDARLDDEENNRGIYKKQKLLGSPTST